MHSGTKYFFSGISGKAALVTVLVIGYFVFNNGIPFILNWDLLGHHAYLPLVFDKGTLLIEDLSYFEAIKEQYHNTPSFYQLVPLQDGHFMIKYTTGWAVLMLPFYCIAELWASLGNYPKDGFSFPYQSMIAIGAFIYFTLAIFVLRRLLLRFFEDGLTALLIVLVAFGTNFFFMQYASLGISHNIEFFLIALMLLLTVRFHEDVSAFNGVQLGLTIGLVALVRPPDVILALIPLGWNYGQYGGFVAKIRYFFKERRKIALLTILAVLVAFSPQIIYWKMIAGSFFMNSYANNAGEGFDWFTPYTLKVLFSFKKGWLLYTPIMIFAIAGFFFWRRRRPDQGNAVLLAFALFIYVISCWTCWWYSDSFSQRSVEDIYPLMAIALGFFITGVGASRLRVLWYALIGCCLALNLFQTYQATKGIIHTSRMTKEYYFSVFGQVAPPSPQQLELLSTDRYALEDKGFGDKSGFRKCYSRRFDFKDFRLTADTIYSPQLDILADEISRKDYFWIVCTWKYRGTPKALEGKIFNTSVMYKGSPYGWKGNSIADAALKVDTLKKEVTFNYLSPLFRRRSKDPLRPQVWNQYGENIMIESVLIEGYEPLRNN